MLVVPRFARSSRGGVYDSDVIQLECVECRTVRLTSCRPPAKLTGLSARCSDDAATASPTIRSRRSPFAARAERDTRSVIPAESGVSSSSGAVCLPFAVAGVPAESGSAGHILRLRRPHHRVNVPLVSATVICMTAQQPLDAVIVGAGFGGMGASIQLKKMGYDNILILDREDDLGGTWHVNHYPGLAVDIPSPTYSYWFEPNPRWSRLYAPGSELKAYARPRRRQVRRAPAHALQQPGRRRPLGRRRAGLAGGARRRRDRSRRGS